LANAAAAYEDGYAHGEQGDGSLPEIASYTGMTVATLERFYWHDSLEAQRNIAETPPKIPPRNEAKRAKMK
jgi:hypothetical protein